MIDPSSQLHVPSFQEVRGWCWGGLFHSRGRPVCVVLYFYLHVLAYGISHKCLKENSRSSVHLVLWYKTSLYLVASAS